MPNRSTLIFLAGCLSIPACIDDQEPITDESQELTTNPDDDPALTPFAACTVSNTDINRSLVVRDPAVLARFSFARVMSRIRSTAVITPTLTNVALFRTWLRTFGSTAAPGDCNDAGIDPNRYGLTCPRTPELKLSTIDPFVAASNVSFRPVALFNRFDLAPANGGNCGEYRIVYALSSTNAAINGRAFIIFEAALANPQPALGARGCLPVAQFWQGLTNDPDATSRATKLERFYFTNGAIPGFVSAVHARNYGLANGTTAAFTAGQVRTNFFIDFAEWQLREFKLRRTCTDPAVPSTCTLRFDHVTVKRNPAEELFAGTHTRSAAFRTSFVNSVPALASTNLNTVGMTITDTFNEFESVSQAGNVVYQSVANVAVRDAIQARLQTIGSTLTVRNILDRATTQTCAGCHQVSSGVALGGGLTWPATLGFVHVDETGALSPALTSRFLPHRKTILEQFINTNCTPSFTATSDDATELTVGGAPVGGAN